MAAKKLRGTVEITLNSKQFTAEAKKITDTLKTMPQHIKKVDQALKGLTQAWQPATREMNKFASKSAIIQNSNYNALKASTTQTTQALKTMGTAGTQTGEKVQKMGVFLDKSAGKATILAQNIGKTKQGLQNLGPATESNIARMQKMGIKFDEASQKIIKLGTNAKQTATPIKQLGTNATQTGQKITQSGTATQQASKNLTTYGTTATATGKKVTTLGSSAGQASPKIKQLGTTSTQTTQSITKSGSAATKTSQQYTTLGSAAGQSSQKMQSLGTSSNQASGALKSVEKSSVATSAGITATVQSTVALTQGIQGTVAAYRDMHQVQIDVEAKEVSITQITIGLEKALIDVAAEERALAEARRTGSLTTEELADRTAKLAIEYDQIKNDQKDLKVNTEELNLMKEKITDTYINMATTLATTVVGAYGAVTQMLGDDTKKTIANIFQKKLAIGTNTKLAASSKISAAGMHGQAAATGTATKATKGLTRAAKGFLFSPVGIALMAMGALWIAWETNALGFRDAIHKVIDALQTVGGYIVDFFRPALNGISTILRAIGLDVPMLGDSFKDLSNDISGNIDKFQEDEKAARALKEQQKSLSETMSDTKTQLYSLDTALAEVETQTDLTATATDGFTEAMEKSKVKITAFTSKLMSSKKEATDPKFFKNLEQEQLRIMGVYNGIVQQHGENSKEARHFLKQHQGDWKKTYSTMLEYGMKDELSNIQKVMDQFPAKSSRAFGALAEESTTAYNKLTKASVPANLAITATGEHATKTAAEIAGVSEEIAKMKKQASEGWNFANTNHAGGGFKGSISSSMTKAILGADKNAGNASFFKYGIDTQDHLNKLISARQTSKSAGNDKEVRERVLRDMWNEQHAYSEAGGTDPKFDKILFRALDQLRSKTRYFNKYDGETVSGLGTFQDDTASSLDKQINTRVSDILNDDKWAKTLTAFEGFFQDMKDGVLGTRTQDGFYRQDTVNKDGWGLSAHTAERFYKSADEIYNLGVTLNEGMTSIKNLGFGKTIDNKIGTYTGIYSNAGGIGNKTTGEKFSSVEEAMSSARENSTIASIKSIREGLAEAINKHNKELAASNLETITGEFETYQEALKLMSTLGMSADAKNLHELAAELNPEPAIQAQDATTNAVNTGTDTQTDNTQTQTNTQTSNTQTQTDTQTDNTQTQTNTITGNATDNTTTLTGNATDNTNTTNQAIGQAEQSTITGFSMSAQEARSIANDIHKPLLTKIADNTLQTLHSNMEQSSRLDAINSYTPHNFQQFKNINHNIQETIPWIMRIWTNIGAAKHEITQAIHYQTILLDTHKTLAEISQALRTIISLDRDAKSQRTNIHDTLKQSVTSPSPAQTGNLYNSVRVN